MYMLLMHTVVQEIFLGGKGGILPPGNEFAPPELGLNDCCTQQSVKVLPPLYF